jgi:hypothetical protein
MRELAADFEKLGLLGMHLTGYGCSGSTATAYGLVCQELEAVDSGLRSNNVREAIAIARQCRTLLGANGITLECAMPTTSGRC